MHFKNLICLILLIACYDMVKAQLVGDFRSKQSGNWNAVTSWQTYNGSAWLDATTAPSSTNGVITIQAGHIITANSNIIADQIVINTNGSLSITSAVFTLNNGSGIDLLNKGSITLSGGTINGNGSTELSSGSAFNWTGGSYGGGGSLKIDASASLNMSGGNHYIGDSATINNYGTWTWSGGIFDYYSTNPTVNNYKTFNINTDYDVDRYSTNTGSFINQAGGVINKTGSISNDTYFSNIALFKNSGTINIDSGTISLVAKFVNTGVISLGKNGTLNFTNSNTSVLSAGSTISGTGTIAINSNSNDSILTSNITAKTINIYSGNLNVLVPLTVKTGNTVNLSNGTLRGNNLIEFSKGSTLNWTGGYLAGKITATIDSAATFNMNTNSHYLADTIILNNHGTWNWTGGNLLYYDGSPVVNNYRTLNINTDNDVDHYYTSTGSFINQSGGVINKTGSVSNDTYFSNISLFRNSGTINIDSGTISLVSRFSNYGTISLGNNGTLNFTNSNTSAINSGSTIKGTGTIVINNNSNDTILTSNITAKAITINSGNLNVLSPLTVKAGNAINLTNGTLRGNSIVEFNAQSSFNWSGGYIAGKVTSTLDSLAIFSMSGASHYIADTIIINNHTTWNWTAGNLIYYNGSPVVNNYRTFNINTDNDVDHYYTSTGIFNNKAGAIINKTGDVSSETYFINFSSFTNAGKINVSSGRFQLYINTTNTGNITVAANSYIQFVAGTTNLNTGGSFSGSGNVNIDGATVNVNASTTISTDIFNLNTGTFSGTSTLTMQSGSVFNWLGGYNGGSGTLSISKGAVLNMNSTGTLYLSDTKKLNNSGTCNWTSGNLNYYNSSPSISNSGVFNIYTDADVSASNNSVGILINQSSGIINKIGSPNDDTRFQGIGSITNAGTINISSSFLRSYVRFVNTGTINTAFGAGIYFTGGTGIFNSGTKLSGAGSLNFDGGTDSINAASITTQTINISNGIVTVQPALNFKPSSTLVLSGGTLNGIGKISFTDSTVFNWSGGSIGGSDSLNIQSGAVANIEGSSLYLNDTKILNNAGELNWSSGEIYLNGGSPSIVNSAAFNINTDNILNGINSTTGKFINLKTGIINKSGSLDNATTFQGFSNFSNGGTININSGVIVSKTLFNNTGIINAELGGVINFSSGIGLFKSGTSIKGAGDITFNGGTDSISAGSFTINHLYVSAGQFYSSIPMSFSSGKDLSLSGGTFFSTSLLNFNSGSSLYWSGGTLGGSDSINLNASSAVTINSGTHYLSNNKIINNRTTLNWSSGDIYLYSGNASINNYSILNISSDNYLSGQQGNTGVFVNQSTGIINKIGSPLNNTYISSFKNFNNYGNINISSGNIALYVSGVHTGTYNIALGAQLSGNISMLFSGKTFTNNGTVLLSGLTFNSSSSQTLNGNGSINVFSLTNKAGIALTGKQIINNTLSLSRGKISLGDSDLVLGDAGTLTGGADTSYIITNGKGSFQRKVSNNNSGVLFPVGTTNTYMPAVMQLTTTSTSDDFKLRVISHLYSTYSNSNTQLGSTISQNSVDATWVIKEATQGGSNATVKLQWSKTNELQGFDHTKSRMAHFVSGGWRLDTAMAASGTDPYSISVSNISAFSPLGITNEFVTCTNQFSTECTGTSFSVPYIAVGTFNTGNKFTAQLSNASGSFASPITIGSRTATTSGTVTAIIPSATTTGSGYRIRVISSTPSFSGSNNGYNISVNDCAENSIATKKTNLQSEAVSVKLNVFPNPTSSYINVRCSLANYNGQLANLDISTITGKIIYSEKVPVLKNIVNKQIHFNTSTPDGIYLLTLKVGNELYVQKVIYNK